MHKEAQLLSLGAVRCISRPMHKVLLAKDREVDAMQRQRAHRQALPLSLALEDALLDKLKAGARLALHPPQPSVAHVRVIEAACSKPRIMQIMAEAWDACRTISLCGAEICDISM